jgi:hypothetical protein
MSPSTVGTRGRSGVRGIWGILVLVLLCACGGAKPTAEGENPSVAAPPSAVIYLPSGNSRLDTQAREMKIGTPPDGGLLVNETTYASPTAAGDPIAFYRTEMIKQGWTLEYDAPPGVNGETLLVYSRDKGAWYAYIWEMLYTATVNEVSRGVPPGGYFVDVAVVQQP